MAKVHEYGKNKFVQYFSFYPAKWGWKVAVKGWTQEINEPFRTATPVIIRLPFKKAIVFGTWTGILEEEQALSNAVQVRVLKDEDFSEDKGWVPAPDQDSEEGSDYLYT